MEETIICRCYDDRCSARQTCRGYQLRHEHPPGSRVAMTWRKGFECHNEPCARYRAMPEEIVHG